jgi:signal peptidase II
MAAASRRTIGLALAAAAVVLLDRLTKAWAVASLQGRPPKRLLGGAVEIVLSENAGAFLSIGGRLPSPVRYALFVVAVAAGLVAASVWLARSRSLPRARSLAIAAMIGGGASNLVDRILRGRVVDFAILRAGPLHTGVFNLADAAILSGAILFVWPALGRRGGPGGEPRRDGDRAGAVTY